MRTCEYVFVNQTYSIKYIFSFIGRIKVSERFSSTIPTITLEQECPLRKIQEVTNQFCIYNFYRLMYNSVL